MSVSDGGADMFKYINRTVLASFEVCLCVFGAVSNLLVVVLVLVDRKLRRSAKYFTILNVCLISLLQIVVLGSTNTYKTISNHAVLESQECLTLILETLGFFNVSVLLLLLSSMCINGFLDVLLPHTSGKRIRLCVALELVLCSWFGSAIVVVPLVVYGRQNPTECFFDLTDRYQTLMGVLHYLPQAVLVFFLGTMLLLCSCVRRDPETPSDRLQEPQIDIFIACIVGVVLNLPFSVFYTGFNQCSTQARNCKSMYIFWVVSSRLSFSTFVFLPLVWLLGRPLRHRCRRLLCCRCCQGQPRVSRCSYISVQTDNDLQL